MIKRKEMEKEALQQRDDMVCLNSELSLVIFYIIINLIDNYFGCIINKEKRNEKGSPSAKRSYGMSEL